MPILLPIQQTEVARTSFIRFLLGIHPKIYITRFNSSYKASEYRNPEQYCFESVIPTLHFQKGLSKLPMPKLESVFPLLMNTLSNYESKDNLTGLNNLGEISQPSLMRLNNILMNKTKHLKNHSWLSDYWLNYHYLTPREPLVLYSNPMLMLNKDLYTNDRELLAAKLIVNTLRVYRSYQEGILVPDIINYDYQLMKGSKLSQIVSILPSTLAKYLMYAYRMYPLDMSQYKKMFGTTRIPKPNKDELTTVVGSKHIIVMINGNMFKLKVLDDDGFIYSIKTVQNTLKILVTMAESCSSPHLGYFTTDNRNRWASVREMIEAIPSYKLNLQTIDGALFVVCLDDVRNSNPDDVYLCKQFLCNNPHNRWFDKSFQLIVDSNGYSGVNFEHSWGDGYPMLMLMDKVTQMGYTGTEVDDCTGVCETKALLWENNPKVLKEIDTSKDNFNKSTSTIYFSHLHIPELNSVFLRRYLPIKPDALIQMAFQLAYFSAYHRTPNIYEAASTLIFAFGRTETLRSVNPKSIEATKFYHDNIERLFEKENLKQLANLSREHSELQTENHIKCLTGLGYDRYFFALECIAVEENIYVPLFDHPIYKKVMHDFDLSTSTLNNRYVTTGGFGPPSNTCMGLAYVINTKSTDILLSCYENGGKSGSLLVESLERTFDRLIKVLNSIDFKADT